MTCLNLTYSCLVEVHISSLKTILKACQASFKLSRLTYKVNYVYIHLHFLKKGIQKYAQHRVSKQYHTFVIECKSTLYQGIYEFFSSILIYTKYLDLISAFFTRQKSKYFSNPLCFLFNKIKCISFCLHL